VTALSIALGLASALSLYGFLRWLQAVHPEKAPEPNDMAESLARLDERVSTLELQRGITRGDKR